MRYNKRMDTTKYTIYWTYKGVRPNSLVKTTLGEALKFVEELRKDAVANEFTFITMVGENQNQVGKAGVDSVVDGKTPDGVDYTWNMSARIGATRK
jgi:hypothetical protein